METRVKCSITMPPGRVWLRPIACNVNFNGGAKDTTNALPDKQVEVGITSLSRQKASPKRRLRLRRAHWNIETGLHYPRDVTFHEDATRMTVGNTGPVMACIDNLVVALIKQANFTNAAQARRSFAGHISQEFFSDYHTRFRTLRKPWIERLRALREWGPVLK